MSPAYDTPICVSTTLRVPPTQAPATRHTDISLRHTTPAARLRGKNVEDLRQHRKHHNHFGLSPRARKRGGGNGWGEKKSGMFGPVRGTLSPGIHLPCASKTSRRFKQPETHSRGRARSLALAIIFLRTRFPPHTDKDTNNGVTPKTD